MISRGSRRLEVQAAACACVLVGAAGVAWGLSGLQPAAARSSSGASSSASQGLDVLPFPGTPDASPGTDVDFPAVSPGEIAAVRVVGSRSGVHAGRLSAQPDGRGTAFSPDRSFSPGERVSVAAMFRSARAGTASGATGAKRVSFSFSVARPVSVSPSASASVEDGVAGSASDAAASSSKTHSFVTEPGFHVPWITTSGTDTDTTSGRIFLNAAFSGQNAAYMVNGKGEVQWYHPTPGFAFDTRVQSYRGQRVITYWRGRVVCPPCGGEGGRDLVLNSSYRTIHTVVAGGGYKEQGTDMHEFKLTPQGTALVGLWTPVRANLSSVGGPPNGTLFDWVIQEIDVATNKVVWEWHAYGHVPVAYTYTRYVAGQPFDYFHLNSIQDLPSGRILISARQTWAVYSIDKKSGKIAWELGGKHSSFSMGSGTRFYWQHDAVLHGNGLFTVFDDGASPQEEPQSRALEIHLANHRATLIHAYTHKPPTLATSQGSVQILRNHNVFVGWGSVPYFSEYTPSGRQIFSDGFLSPIQSYRAYREPWTGHPPWGPAVAVRRTSTRNAYNVYVSWNGATEVARWRVLAGPSSTGPFKPLKTVAWHSFETRAPVSTQDAYFEVQGLGKKGKLLSNGTSAVVQAGK